MFLVDVFFLVLSFSLSPSLFKHKTSCQGSWQGRILSVRWTQPATSLCCLPGLRTAGCGHAGTPAVSVPGRSELGMHTQHKTAKGDTVIVRHSQKQYVTILSVEGHSMEQHLSKCL